jgi:hypothetical protein
MKSQRHFEHDELIDFVEGEAGPGLAREIKHHLKTCETCRAYVESLGRMFAVLERDKVPAPSPGYWDFFEQRVRERAKPAAGAAGKPVRRRSLVFIWLPGLAAAAALVTMLWWLPDGKLSEPGGPGSGMAQVDPVDVLLADLSTGEIIESLSGDPDIGLMLTEAGAEHIAEIDEYLSETTGIYDLVDQLSMEEQEIFMSRLKTNMSEEDNTSGIANGSARKGC